MLAHGGTAGLALELGIVLVPLLCIVLLLWWGKRKERSGGTATPEDAGRQEGGP